MTSTKEWQARIRLAKTEAAVLAVVLEYLRGLPAEQLARLPESCRPGPFEERDDVVGYNVQLARDELVFTGDAEVASFLREIQAVMNEAASRFTQISVDAVLKPRS